MTLHAESFSGPRAFARWMLIDGSMPIQNDLSRIRAFRGCATEVILFSESCWQVELICVYPGAVIPRHRHLRVDSCELAIGGSAIANIDGAVVNQVPRGRLCANLIRVPAGAWHGGIAGSQGVVWLSFQHWLDGVPGWITDDWQE